MIFGRPVPRINARRLVLLFGSLSLLALTLTALLTSSMPSSPTLTAIEEKLPAVPESIKNKIPSISKVTDKISNSKYNPFHKAPRPPPKKDEDQYKGSSWWADWKWLSVPFSSTLKQDDDRALLPPLTVRPPIYCYYDSTVKKTAAEKDAESELLLTWRRAWWAQGFSPMIIGPTEAMHNPLYMELQHKELPDAIKEDMMRWMAWEAVDGGLLAYETLLPMAPAEDDTMVFLRRAEYPSVTNWKALDSGLLAGPKDEVTKAIRGVLDSKQLSKATSVIDAVPEKLVVVDKDASALAYYSPEIVKEKYGNFGNGTIKDRTRSLQDLNQLINAHLHVLWQNIFTDGVEVLKPFPNHTTPMIQVAMDYAQALVSCPRSPLPATCPPNVESCVTCRGDRSQLNLETSQFYQNKSTVFTIGTVPHPWTLAVMDNMKANLDAAFIRRKSPRDPWLTVITEKMLGEDISAATRVITFKEAVASEFAAAHALWLQAEVETPVDLGWRFGFALPKIQSASSSGSSGKDSVAERNLLDEARQVVALTKSTKATKTRASMEAWSMADTEAWRFAKAFMARRTLERLDWEKEEEKYQGGAGSESGRSSWNRWGDLKDGKKAKGA